MLPMGVCCSCQADSSQPVVKHHIKLPQLLWRIQENAQAVSTPFPAGGDLRIGVTMQRRLQPSPTSSTVHIHLCLLASCCDQLAATRMQLLARAANAASSALNEWVVATCPSSSLGSCMTLQVLCLLIDMGCTSLGKSWPSDHDVQDPAFDHFESVARPC